MGEFQEPWYKRPDTSLNEPQDVDRAKQGELMIKFLSTVENIGAFKGKSLKDIFKDEENKRIFINNLTPEQFENLLAGINGILRDKDKDDWTLDGNDVGLKGMIANAFPPDYRDKLELLEKTLSAAQKMNREKRSLQEIALLLSSMINEIHAFGDANGRTSRFVYHMITESKDALDKKRIAELLSRDGRYEINIDPSSLNSEIVDLLEKEIFADEKIILGIDPKNEEDIEYSNDLTEEEVILFSERLDDDESIMRPALYKFLKSRTDKDKYLILNKKRPNLVYIKLKETIESTSAPEFRQILDNYRQLKKRHAELLIDIIANPDKKIYQIEYEGEIMPLKKYYEIKLDSNFMLNKNFGRS